MNIPRHIAIIMDGNGRWARKQGLPRIMGHYKGAQAAEEITKACIELGVEYLTLFAFSTENWNRPEEEIQLLFELLRNYLKEKREELIELGVRLRFIGRRDRIGKDLRLLMERLERDTERNSKINVILAVDYGGRDDILRAVNKLIRLEFDYIDEETFSHFLDLGDVPDPDLLIRTAGEKRVSNFLLWNIAYTELYFTETYWPDFTPEELHKAIEDFSGRKRKFGRVLDE
ncbi:undecaprenyl diphosphate synthase [Hydrogenivirga caldilitoris]|uniref:Isoprenyl transferase n=1 Tax=Hydrogenivirga caldilitoris TaxID=246264 RepID=A0A497XPQ5_9AQUI|nr:polyprenyl diphosphate synthase [Hydrogenivirga caldilitoris]RLJ70935.1 undecaprenyl diphosphate synthase [Hydrogenivirga caldilitoris]